MVQAIQLGRIDPNRKFKRKEPEEKMWDIWGETEEQDISKKMPPQISAPKLNLPGHAESYNPSEEYLLTQVNFHFLLNSYNFVIFSFFLKNFKFY